MASPALVVGMQDNEYTDAQVGDAGGLFKSLDPAPCGAVPVYLIQSPIPVYLIQSPIPVYLIQCSSSMQSASSSGALVPVPVYLIQWCSSSSLPHPVLQFHAVCFFTTLFLKCNNVFIQYTHYYCHSDFLCFRLYTIIAKYY